MPNCQRGFTAVCVWVAHPNNPKRQPGAAVLHVQPKREPHWLAVARWLADTYGRGEVGCFAHQNSRGSVCGNNALRMKVGTVGTGEVLGL